MDALGQPIVRVADLPVIEGHDVLEMPLADGGEGTLDVLGGPNRSTVVTGPLGDPVEARWLLTTDGGDFDQLTGASVTPRAVIKAIRETLLYFAANRDEIFAAPATGEQE